MIVIVEKIISIFLITAVGFLANRKGILPDQSNRYLVDLLMMITTPCMVLASITSTELTDDTFVLTLQMLLCAVIWFAVSCLLSWIFCIKILKMGSDPNAGVYMAGMTTINNGFMGFPITMALFGADVLFFMVLFQMILTIYLYSGCIIQVNYGSKGRIDLRAVAKHLTNPCTLAAFLGIAMLLLGLHLPDMLFETVDTIGSATVPISMLVVGIQLGSSRISEVIHDRKLVITSIVKMLLWPVLTFLAVNWLPLPVNMKIALVFGAAFPTAVAVVAITSMENRNAVLAAEIIAFTTLLSIITLPVSALLLMGYYGLV